MLIIYQKTYNTDTGKKKHKFLTKVVKNRNEFVKWLNDNNVIVKDVRT